MPASKLLCLLLLTLVTACSKPPSSVGKEVDASAPSGGRDWSLTVVKTPEAGFAIGSPTAPVQIIEYASTTCPACKRFHEESGAALKKDYIAKGLVRFEFRNFALNGPDTAAALLIRCGGAKRFFPLLDAFFDNQHQWIKPFLDLDEADQKALAALPEAERVHGLAVAGKLKDWVRRVGIGEKAFAQCLKDPAALTELASVRTDGMKKYGIAGTPTFVLNGEVLSNVIRWDDMEPKIKAALP